ncbi:hypothetical protein HQ47_02110 [Porphyromonas macacae]|uniref:Uncharacterized protein n=1 Tax=Porphyromonas macacae TaxID=28115 RepID=A0A0A2EBX5_9PORP|nr:hypothetical protein HQ47_02110 [Porphyromonas macacae]
MRKVQGAKTEAEGSVLKYVAEAKGRKECSNLRLIAPLHFVSFLFRIECENRKIKSLCFQILRFR